MISRRNNVTEGVAVFTPLYSINKVIDGRAIKKNTKCEIGMLFSKKKVKSQKDNYIK